MRINGRNEELGQISLVRVPLLDGERFAVGTVGCTSPIPYRNRRLLHVSCISISFSIEARVAIEQKERKKEMCSNNTRRLPLNVCVRKQVSETRKFFTSHAQIIFHFYLSYSSPHGDKARPTPTLTARLFFFFFFFVEATLSFEKKGGEKKKRGRRDLEERKIESSIFAQVGFLQRSAR